MSKLKVSIALACCLIFAAYLAGALSNRWERERQQQQLLSKLKAAVEQGRSNNGNKIIPLKDLTSFGWDRMYVFMPYTDTNKIERALGFSWPQAASTGIYKFDTFQLLVFTDRGRVVSYLRCPFELGEFLCNHGRLPTPEGLSPEEAKFRVDIEDGGVVLRPQNTKCGDPSSAR